ncbi:MAG: hypothetical protein SYC29_03000 [Planctomycetota bacterium]|nr:hypothetical protein [Planctomycetota bacterium]
MNRLACMLIALASLSIVAAAGTASAGSADGRPAAIDVSLEDGSLAWRLRSPSARPEVRRTVSDGSILTDWGVLVGSRGTILARVHDGRVSAPRGTGRALDCPFWDELAEITPPTSGFSDAHAPLLKDSAGNVWVINTHIEGGYELQVRRSEGHSGDWLPMETISDTTNYVSQPQGTIDGEDNITIVFRDIAGGYRLFAIRYEPGSGWGALTQIYSTAAFFQAIEIAADEDGDVVAIFDPELGADPAVWSLTRDAGNGQWGTAERVSASGMNILLPTVARNESGSALYLVYLAVSGGEIGLWGHRWDADANAWEEGQLLPGTEDAGYTAAGPVSRFPLAVGPDGEASVLWQTADPGPYGVYASRTDGGVWQPAHELLAPGPDDTDIENFAYMHAGAPGDVMGVITRYESGNNRVWAFRHSANEGWHDAVNPYTSALNISTRIRAAFYQGARAFASFYGRQDNQNQLTSILYTGIGWLDELIDIPGTYIAYYQDPIVDRGEALLVFEAESGGNQGIKASWLRNVTGDIDCDGDVDSADLLDLLAAWGDCPDPPSMCPADLNGDGTVSTADLLDLLANWG